MTDSQQMLVMDRAADKQREIEVNKSKVEGKRQALILVAKLIDTVKDSRALTPVDAGSEQSLQLNLDVGAADFIGLLLDAEDLGIEESGGFRNFPGRRFQ